MSSGRILELSEEGRRKIESVSLSKLEAAALIGASKMSLKDDLTKNTKLTRAVLADTLMKILPLCNGLFQKRGPNPDLDITEEGMEEKLMEAQHMIEKENEKSILAAVVEKTTNMNSSKHSKDGSNKAAECLDKQEMPVCRFFLIGNCKFEKSEDKKCPYSHPKVCKAYDKKGPSGCHEKECPLGLHRKICEKLINGDCRRKPEKCGFYHPTQLRRSSRAKKKKEESSDKSEWLETMMDGIKKFSLSPPIMQFPMYPMYPVIAVMAIPPPPPTSKRGRKGQPQRQD